MESLETPEQLENSALKQFQDEIGGVESQQILRDWFARFRKQVDPNTDQYGEMVLDAVGILERIRQGITGAFWIDEIVGDKKRAKRYAIWAWPSESGVREWAYRGTGTAGLEDLDQALAHYLKCPWLQHDAIDVSAINALLVMELSELISDILTGTALGRPNWSFILSGGNMFAQFCLAIAGKIIGFFAAWIMLPAISIGLFAHGNYTGAIIAIGFWGLYVVYRLIMIPAGWRNRRLRGKAAEKLNERLEAMMKAWNAARGAAINPSRLKELVLGAEERGAMFPSVLHTIIDRAIKRDPTVLTRVR